MVDTWFLVVGCFLGALVRVGPAHGWAVSTGVSDPCHEKMVDDADGEKLFAIVDLDTVNPTGSEWRKVSRALLEEVGINANDLNDKECFLLMSLVAGVRFPDTDGHSIMNLDTLRLVHSDPSALGTYGHCVRGPNDDYEEGNASAIAGARMFIRDYIEEANLYMRRPAGSRIVEQKVYFDFYGLFDAQIYAPFFYIGKATHTLQDCFSHTIRSEADDLTKIVHVLNYVDAISDDYREERDGMAHSEYMDKCQEADLAPLVEAAVRATGEFFDAAAVTLETGDNTPVREVMDAWMTFVPGCNLDNDMCGNHRMLELARRDPTEPYLKKLMGCSTLPGHPGPKGSFWAFFAALLFD